MWGPHDVTKGHSFCPVALRPQLGPSLGISCGCRCCCSFRPRTEEKEEKEEGRGRRGGGLGGGEGRGRGTGRRTRQKGENSAFLESPRSCLLPLMAGMVSQGRSGGGWLRVRGLVTVGSGEREGRACPGWTPGGEHHSPENWLKRLAFVCGGHAQLFPIKGA